MSYMKMEVPFFFRYSEFDIYDHILPNALLNAFQDIAGEHAEEIGVGYKTMIEKNLIWVLVRTKYELLKNPEVDKEYILRTWPLPKGSVDFNRDYLIIDKDENVIAKATSKWAVTNFVTRRLVRSRDVTYEGGDYYPHQNFEEDISNFDSPAFDIDKPKLTHPVRFTDLDHNHHMNNTKYAILVIDALEPKADEYISDFQINYLVECNLGDIIDVYVTEESGYYYVTGIKNHDTTKIFVARVKLSKTN